MVEQDGDRPEAAGNRIMGNQQKAAAVHGPDKVVICGATGVKYPLPKPRLADPDTPQAQVELVMKQLQERAMEEIGDLMAQFRRSAVQPEKLAPTDLNGYVLVKRCDLVPLLVSIYGPDEVNKRLRELIYAYPRQGDD